MMFTIRIATPDDAETIATLNNRIWPDLPTTAARVAQTLIRSENVCLIATLNGQSAGFIDGFALPAPSNNPKNHSSWEIDLLAVAPEARHQGLATTLINQILDYAPHFACDCARAVVRLDNTGAEHAFQANQFEPSHPLHLMIANPQPHTPITLAVPPQWQTVNTLTYRGLWIEHPSSFLKVARATAHTLYCDSVGMLVPTEDGNTLDTLTDLGFESAGIYRRWSYKINNTNAPTTPNL